MDVIKRPRSTAGVLSYSFEKSSEPQCAKRVLGSGASTKIKAERRMCSEFEQSQSFGDVPTSSGSQLLQSAHERMMSRKPTARMNDKKMTAKGSVSHVEELVYV